MNTINNHVKNNHCKKYKFCFKTQFSSYILVYLSSSSSTSSAAFSSATSSSTSSTLAFPSFGSFIGNIYSNSSHNGSSHFIPFCSYSFDFSISSVFFSLSFLFYSCVLRFSNLIIIEVIFLNNFRIFFSPIFIYSFKFFYDFLKDLLAIPNDILVIVLCHKLFHIID